MGLFHKKRKISICLSCALQNTEACHYGINLYRTDCLLWEYKFGKYPDVSVKCPKCLSNDIVKIYSDRHKCNKCGNIFS